MFGCFGYHYTMQWYRVDFFTPGNMPGLGQACATQVAWDFLEFMEFESLERLYEAHYVWTLPFLAEMINKNN